MFFNMELEAGKEVNITEYDHRIRSASTLGQLLWTRCERKPCGNQSAVQTSTSHRASYVNLLDHVARCLVRLPGEAAAVGLQSKKEATPAGLQSKKEAAPAGLHSTKALLLANNLEDKGGALLPVNSLEGRDISAAFYAHNSRNPGTKKEEVQSILYPAWKEYDLHPEDPEKQLRLIYDHRTFSGKLYVSASFN